MESNILLPPSQFSYRRSLGTCDALHTLSHYLQVALDRVWRKDLFSWISQLHLIGVSQRGLLHKLRSIRVGRQSLSKISELLSDRRQHVRLNGKN